MLERIASYLPKAGTLERLMMPAEVGRDPADRNRDFGSLASEWDRSSVR
jgi:hypothetical protein